jgi:hypothetical protein
MSPLLETILHSTYTLHDLKHRVRILHQVVEGQIFGNGDTMLLAEDVNWLRTLPEDFFKQFEKDKFSSIFENLEIEVNKINPLTIYLAFEPGKPEIEAINSWVRQNLQTKVVIETKLDPSLMGGVALVWNGVYKDYSLKAKIAAEEAQIIEEFKKSWR